MAIIAFGLIFYWLILLCEQALVNLSAHDLDILRTLPDRAARRVVLLTDQLRSSLAALLLARVLIAILFGLQIGWWMLTNSALKSALFNFSQQNSVAPELVWGIVASLITLIPALFFWGMNQFTVFSKKSANTSFWLQRLSLFASIWRTLFTPFIRREKTIETSVEPVLNPPPPAAVTSEKRELELLKSIVQFGDVTIKQVMQPRSKVVAVDFRTDFNTLLLTVQESEFSRLPVIDEDLDNVTGILYVKDLVPHLDKPPDFEWQSLIRTNVMLVPESKRGSELLQEFKQEKMHMAIVVDEYGGSAGIVTLEDILEEVTGDIRDEFDEDSEIRYRKLDEFNYLFEGQTLLNDVCRIAGLPTNVFETSRGNSDTLAGLALEIRGDIPAVGEEIPCGNYHLTVTAADNRRIEQLRLTLPKPK
ncbi:MAG: CBS domain-containing protein [Saprospiraceae bacterium]|nr:CBS domain-containing protein [Saprospiraceae bacterium]